MLNGSVFGQRFYAAKNPSWTVHKPTMALRANGQVKGKYGHGAQAIIRRAFALTQLKTAGMTGFALVNGKMTPRPAAYAQQNLKSAYSGHPEIAVGAEARRQKMLAMRQESHASNVAKWEGGNAMEFMPGGALSPEVGYNYERYR